MVLHTPLSLSKSFAPTAVLLHPCHECARRLTGIKDDMEKNNAAQASTVLERNIYMITALDCIFKMDIGTFALSFYFLLPLQAFFW